MASNWRESTVIELQNAGYLLVEDGNHGEYRPRHEEFVNHGTAFIRAADMDESGVNFNTASRINEIALKRITKGIGAGGDVLLSHKGTVGKIAIAPLDAPSFVCSPQTTFWRTLDNNFIDRRYLYAYMRSEHFRRQLNSRKGETDMADYVSLTAQRTFRVLLPPIEEQRAIAGILGALDDKIELNRRINQTLESMARAVFRQWFVEDEEVGDWKVGKLGKVADVNWGDTNTTKSSYVENGYPAYSAKGQDGYLSYYDFDRTGIVVSAIGANSGASWLALGKWSCIKNTLRFWATSDEISTEYLFYATLGNEKWPLRGSAQPFIAQGDAREMKIVIPPNKLAIRFAETVRPMIEMQKHNEKESRTLASLRDSLLPKLMRGEVRVKS